MAPGLPRLGPGLQLKMLIRVCSSRRLAHWCRNGMLAVEKDSSTRRPCGMQVLHYFFSRHMAFPRCGCIRHHPGFVTVSYGRDVVVNVREDLRVRVTQK